MKRNLKMTYNIIIDDAQRLALLALLEKSQTGLNTDDSDPLQYWQDMLRELPDMEKQDPKIQHGFCL